MSKVKADPTKGPSPEPCAEVETLALDQFFTRNYRNSEMLTDSEVQSLLRADRETRDYARKAFAHLRPKI